MDFRLFRRLIPLFTPKELLRIQAARGILNLYSKIGSNPDINNLSGIWKGDIWGRLRRLKPAAAVPKCRRQPEFSDGV
jgi:hypothetical protein